MRFPTHLYLREAIAPLTIFGGAAIGLVVLASWITQVPLMKSFVNSYIVKPVEFDSLEVGFYWLILNHPPEGLTVRGPD